VSGTEQFVGFFVEFGTGVLVSTKLVDQQ